MGTRLLKWLPRGEAVSGPGPLTDEGRVYHHDPCMGRNRKATPHPPSGGASGTFPHGGKALFTSTPPGQDTRRPSRTPNECARHRWSPRECCRRCPARRRLSRCPRPSRRGQRRRSTATSRRLRPRPRPHRPTARPRSPRRPCPPWRRSHSPLPGRRSPAPLWVRQSPKVAL